MGSHSFTCHPHTNHTCLQNPAKKRHGPLAVLIGIPAYDTTK